MVLAVAYLIRVPWLLDPLLGGLTAALLYHFARRAYGETQGRAVAVLFALSPVTLLMSASYMNHVPVLLLAVAVLAALTEWERAVTTAPVLSAAISGIGKVSIRIVPSAASVAAQASAACPPSTLSISPSRIRRP